MTNSGRTLPYASRLKTKEPPWPVSVNVRPVVRYGAALVIVLAAASLAQLLFELTNDTRLSMVFLSGVLIAAVLFGSGPGYLAALVAFLIYNYDLVDPRFTLSLGTTEDFVTLIGFLAVATLTGNLTTRIRSEAARARARANTTDVLFAATQEFSASSDEGHIRTRLAHHLAMAAGGAAFVREGLKMQLDPPDAVIPREVILEAGAMARRGWQAENLSPSSGWTLRSLRADSTALGVAAWRTSAPDGLRPEQQTLLEILADAGAAAIARARLAAGKAEAEARARTEDLRNALLSSISHDMRTPLAAIMVSASSLRRYGPTFDTPTQQDLAATIEEEATRLDAFVANLLNMSRLEAGALTVQRVGFSVAEVIERTLARHDAGQQRVRVVMAANLNEGLGDPLLFEQALSNIVENAVRYVPPAAAIEILARQEKEGIVVEVIDEGPGVSPADLSRIFEKFFRSSAPPKQPGTGLGLSIARGLMEGMGGAVEAHNRDDGRSGLVVRIRLPVTT